MTCKPDCIVCAETRGLSEPASSDLHRICGGWERDYRIPATTAVAACAESYTYGRMREQAAAAFEYSRMLAKAKESV